jgi:hypothetical protein
MWLGWVDDETRLARRRIGASIATQVRTLPDPSIEAVVARQRPQAALGCLGTVLFANRNYSKRQVEARPGVIRSLAVHST